MVAVNGQEDFKTTVESWNRVSNLASKADFLTVRSDLLSDPAEKQLYKAWHSINEKYRSTLNNDKAAGALEMLSGLKDDITSFFDAVMVMADDEDIRKNRLALLAAIDNDLKVFADFSKLVWA
ncbi:Glycine--tRNA ligase beta subunit [compost metagenome]